MLGLFRFNTTFFLLFGFNKANKGTQNKKGKRVLLRSLEYETLSLR